MTQPLRIAIVGMETHPGQIISVAGQAGDLEIVALADERGNHAKRATDYPDWVLYESGDYERMFDEQRPDIVAVACRHSEKWRPIVAAIQRGMHVMADKPLCTEPEQLEAIETARRSQPQVHIGLLMTLRSSPHMQRMKEMVRAGAVGVVVCCYAKRCFGLKQATRPDWYWDDGNTGGPTVELSLHDLDIVRWITGLDVSEVTAHEIQGGYEQWPSFTASGACFYRLTNDASLIIEHSRYVQQPLTAHTELHITGKLGELIYRATDREELWVYTGGEPRIESNLPATVPIFRQWVDGFRSNDRNPAIATDEVLDLTRATFVARASARSGRKLRRQTDNSWVPA